MATFGRYHTVTEVRKRLMQKSESEVSLRHVAEYIKNEELKGFVERSRYRGGKNKFISVANSQPKV